MLSSYNLKSKVDVQGHRGFRGLYPENTLPAFAKAIEIGVTTLELDVIISKDNKVVVSHEPYLNPLICLDTDKSEIPDSLATKRNLYKLTYDEIRQFDCGSKEHPFFPNQERIATYKPLLTEVFDLAASLDSDVHFNIEIKARPEYDYEYTPEPEVFVDLVLKVIQNSGMLHRSTLQSFDLRILEAIRKQNSDITVALLIDENEDIDKKMSELSFQPQVLSPYFKLLSVDIVKAKKKEGFQIIPWTVNETFDIDEVLSWNVDGIISDYPDRVLKIVNP
jgi:glycerophosphoryl diester phosphodiesterase